MREEAVSEFSPGPAVSPFGRTVLPGADKADDDVGPRKAPLHTALTTAGGP
ncbi:hypothetical protein ACFXJ5_12805 [Streptomyces sp. NPDC059373]